MYEGDERHGLVIVVWNIAGLARATNSLLDSPDFLTMLAKHDPDIVMFQETWLGPGSKTANTPYLTGYKHYKSVAHREQPAGTPSLGRRGRCMGGVSTWVKKSLRPDTLISEKFRETPVPLRGYVLPLVLDDGHAPLLMPNTYLPPPPPAHPTLAARHSPLSTHHSPQTTHHSPIPPSHSPLVPHHSPLRHPC